MVTLGAINDAGSATPVTLTITIGSAAAPTGPQITSVLTASGTVGSPFSYAILTSGTAPVAVGASPLPPGLSLLGNAIIGTPTTPGTDSITLSASNQYGIANPQILVVTVVGGVAPVITSATSEDIALGKPFSYLITASGSPTSFSASPLPSGLSLTGATIAGTPTAIGITTVTLGASNAYGPAAPVTLTIQVGKAPVLTSSLAANAGVNAPFSYTLTASGDAPVTLSASGLPANWTFTSATGVISGTPTATGSISIPVGASNPFGATAPADLVITVGNAPSLTSALAVNAGVNQPFTYTLTASGGTPPTLSATGLPGSWNFVPATGVLTGTPSATGTISIAVGASNAYGATAPANLVITVGNAPAITSALTEDAAVGSPFTYTLTASGDAPLTLSATSLPGSWSFVAATGVISGTPSVSGTITIPIGASNPFGTTAPTNLLITVGGPPSITSALAVNAAVGQPFTYTLTAGGTAPLTLSASGLPSGWNFVAATGVITGTPTVTGTISIAVGASNAFGSTAPANLVITVGNAPQITSLLTANAGLGQPFAYTLTASGDATITFGATSLPGGWDFASATGVLTGTPSSLGQVSIPVSATNPFGSAAGTLMIMVGNAPQLTSALTAAAGLGQPFSYTLTASGDAPLALSATSLPSGWNFTAATGVITGTPAAVGPITIQVGASNAYGSAMAPLVITVGNAPQITSLLTANAGLGQPFSYTLTAGGDPTITLGATSLPSGWSFASATGVLTGTPSSLGQVSIPVSATNPFGSAAGTLVITVGNAPQLTSVLSAAAGLGQLFSYTLTANGDPPLTLSATSLPSGWSFTAATGVITGTPAAVGPITIQVGASNAFGSASAPLLITVGNAPVITSALAVNAGLGLPFSYAITATGDATITFGASGLPSGWSFVAATGTIIGTPSAISQISIPVSATNASGSANATLVITVGNAPVITSAPAVNAGVGLPFSYTIMATGDPTISFGATGLPGSWNVVDASGIITGMPSATGQIQIQISATNLFGTAQSLLTVTVGNPPLLTSALTANATVDTLFSYALTSSGDAPLTLTATPLPSGWTFDGDNISGTPTVSGTITIPVGASNPYGTTAPANLVITVGGPPSITSALAVDAVVGQPFTYTLTSAGTAPLTLTASPLPGGWTFTPATGVITGTPDAVGTITIPVGASNAFGATAPASLVITVGNLPVITSVLAVNAAVSLPFSYTLTASGAAPPTLVRGSAAQRLELHGHDRRHHRDADRHRADQHPARSQR